LNKPEFHSNGKEWNPNPQEESGGKIDLEMVCTAVYKLDYGKRLRPMPTARRN